MRHVEFCLNSTNINISKRRTKDVQIEEEEEEKCCAVNILLSSRILYLASVSRSELKKSRNNSGKTWIICTVFFFPENR